ncbi:MAG TPA: glucose-6-phosphate dehydrogenase, partial [Actinomycetota bacterium]|nr:glucose-6-phosphate dehydrogenase [Actinomycetota bacterium]
MGLSPRTTPDPCVVVIFGASGDLAARKLVPALHNLQMEGHIPRETAVIGTSRTPHTDAEFAEQMREAVEEHSRLAPTDESWSTFFEDLHYVPADVTDEAGFRAIEDKIADIESKHGTHGNRLWYFALLPEF